MQWSRSILGDGRTMSRGTVALVVIPLIGGIARIALRDGDHQPVTGDFCDNRSSRHGGTMLVTACGMLLLLAQVQVGMRQRHQELVVWRTLGAGKKLLRTTLWCEFAMLGFVSGLVAAIGAETALAVLQSKVFDFPWEPDWRLWIVLPCSGALLLSLCGGWLGARLLKGKALFRQFVG